MSRTKVAVLWNAGGRVARVALQMLFILLMGRVLGPTEFGIVTLALIPFQIATTLGTRTFTQALIQNQSWMDGLHRETARASVVSGLVVFVLIAACGLAFGYANQSWDYFIIIAAMGLSAPISSMAVVAQARLSKDMEFAKISLAETIASIAAVAAGLAYLYIWRDVYAVAVYALTQRSVETLLIYTTARRRSLPAPTENATLQSTPGDIKPVVRFTAPLFGMNLLTAAIQSIDQIFVALLIGTEALGLYGMARRITEQPARLIVQALERALFPAAVHSLDSRSSAGQIYERAIVTICFVSGAAFFVLAAVAPTLVPLLLGDHWRTAVPFVQVFAVQSAVLPVGAVFLSFITAAGATGKQFAFTLTRFATLLISTVFLAWLLDWSAMELAIATTVANLLLVYPNMLLAERTAGVSSRAGGISILRGLAPGAIAGLAAYSVSGLDFTPALQVAIALSVALAALVLSALIIVKPAYRKARNRD